MTPPSGRRNSRRTCLPLPESSRCGRCETDVNDLIEEVVKLLAPTLGRQIEIETALSDRAWPALVDRSRLTSALVNLAINARDAMPDGAGCCSGRAISPAMRTARRWTISARATTSPSRSSIAAPAFPTPYATGFSSRSFRPSNSAPAPGSDLEHGVRICQTVRRRRRGRRR